MKLHNWIARAALILALPVCAFADLSATKILMPANGALNLDNGTTGNSGGDILWNGITLLPQGTAKAFNIAVINNLNPFISKDAVDAYKQQATAAAIPASTLVMGDVFVVFTNGGNSSAVLVKANDGVSLTLQFTTFGTTGSSGPTIAKVLNNSSEIPDGFPNSGIAQSSLFKIVGSSLADPGNATLHETDPQRQGSPLPTTLNNATVTVTSNGTIVHPALYYATPTQIDAVLPAATPLGAATVTVTYSGTVSNTFPIQVVAAAPGITTYEAGTAVGQDVSRLSDPIAGLVTFTQSAAPGAGIILWGTGLGAAGSSDTTYDTSSHQINIPYTVYVGGVPASIGFAGASVYPGVGVLGITIPANAPTGCYVPIAAVATVNGKTIVSNIATLPIHANGGVCSDPQLGYDGTQISTLNGRGSVNNGFLLVSQSTAPDLGVTNTASAIFQQTAGVSAAVGGTVSIGGCALSQTLTGSVATTGLGAGTITVTGPGTGQITLNSIPQSVGLYAAAVPSIPSTGAAYVFNGSGTATPGIGSFTASVSFPNPLLVWTSAAAVVPRTQDLNISWTGGAPGTYVLISGNSTSGSAVGSYNCIVPQSASPFRVPSYILMGLPAGTGTTTVQNSTNFTTFSADRLDFGAALGSVSFTVNSTYN